MRGSCDYKKQSKEKTKKHKRRSIGDGRGQSKKNQHNTALFINDDDDNERNTTVWAARASRTTKGKKREKVLLDRNAHSKREAAVEGPTHTHTHARASPW